VTDRSTLDRLGWLHLAPWSRYAGLGLLMLAVALTEGLGLLLLVPLLGLLAPSAEGGRIAMLFERFGLSPQLYELLALFVALVALRAALVYARGQSALRMEIALADGLRRRAWDALLHCDWRVLAGMRRADSASLLITEIDRSGICINQAIAALAMAVTLAGLGLAAFAISPEIAGGALLAGLMLIVLGQGIRRRSALFGAALGQAYARIYAEVQDGLGALRVIKSTTSEDQASAAIMDQFARLRTAQRAYSRDLGLGQALLQIGGAALLALLVWLALSQWQSPLASILPLTALFARALPLLGGLIDAVQQWAHARPAINTAVQLIAKLEQAREPDPGAVTAPPLMQQIELTKVSVRFETGTAPALDEVTAIIPARAITALIGPSGAGKSTLADILGGLLSPDSGSLTIDGRAIEGPLRQAWRARVAYVQQDPVLRSASLRDNLLWAAPDASDDQLRVALEDASAGFAVDWPAGLDTLLGDGGRALSGGERQRLMLARALLRGPALLILDEATSALDAGNEAQIAEALLRLKTRMAVVIIGHRGALPLLADHTIRLEQGRCTEHVEPD
jgi:ATP-binding cassette subfamily C protein